MTLTNNMVEGYLDFVWKLLLMQQFEHKDGQTS